MEINSGRQICDASSWIWFQSILAEKSYLKPEIEYGGWGWREGEKREIQNRDGEREKGGWNQPIWKRGDRKSLWQPSIMRFGSLYGFLFTWKGINIKHTHKTSTETHIFTFVSHLFKPSSLHIHPSHSVISASGGSIISLFIAMVVFLPGFKGSERKQMWLRCAV